MTGGLTAPSISIQNYIDFAITATPSQLEGRVHWDDNVKTLSIDTSDSNVNIQVGHNNLIYVDNQLASTLTKGTVVYINGGNANKPTVATASYENDLRSASTIGFIASNITSGQKGYVITYGLLENVNTNAYTPGTMLYLGTNGTFTSTLPVAPLHAVRLGKVIRQSATVGTIFVTIQNGYELNELHDVAYVGGTPSNNSVLQYITSNNRWENISEPTLNGLTVSGYKLNTNTWTASNILVINGSTNSVIGSGYKFNDGGTSSTDIWSARQSIDNIITLTLAGARSGANVSNVYLRSGDGLPYNTTPMIMPFDGTIKHISMSTSANSTWIAEVRDNGTAITGATISNTTTGTYSSFNINVNAGAKLQLYCNGSSVANPRMLVTIVKR